jgi:DNA end-binding protein Ku
MWSGSISFGLVNIPVNLYTASQERELTFHLLHTRDRSPIRFARICKSDGHEVANDEIVKGFEWKKGEFVILDDEDFKHANLRKSRSIEIFEFINDAEIDPMYYEKPYFVEPRQSDKAYAILHEALKRTGKAGLAKFVLQHKEQLGIVRASGDMLMLVQVRFPEELRKPAGINIPSSKKGSDKEVRVAMQLIEKQSAKFHPSRYHDEYSKDLRALIAKKAKGKRVKVTGKEPVATQTNQIMAELERSLRKAPPRRSRRYARA